MRIGDKPEGVWDAWNRVAGKPTLAQLESEVGALVAAHINDGNQGRSMSILGHIAASTIAQMVRTYRDKLEKDIGRKLSPSEIPVVIESVTMQVKDIVHMIIRDAL